ncbi:hypothetical protein AAVH_14471 [Aphelenchoides avenae]|nr:hypothetical protein AAVH_14471 [Aphelenchus avenae]
MSQESNEEIAAVACPPVTENGAASTSDRTEAKGAHRSEEFDLQTVRNVLNHISAVADLLPALEQQEAYDELREKLLRRLDGCARRLERADTTREKLTIMEEMKASEIYYDLQLVEHANQLPLLHVARTVFSLSEKRTADRAPAKAPRPMRRKNASSALTSLRRLERERDRQSPSLQPPPQDDSELPAGLRRTVEEAKKKKVAEADAELRRLMRKPRRRRKTDVTATNGCA